jgi:DNA polymerase III epsilon subunit-like protein
VDIETAGPNPSQYSLLTIGACLVYDHRKTFYTELRPVNNKMTPESFGVHHLDLKRLQERGVPPERAMENLEAWVKESTPAGCRPVFVAFNASFDWMFVSDYFHRFLGRNPFGHAALDIKALYMGLTGVPFAETTMSYIMPRYLRDRELTHHALRDALDQAEIFEKILAEAQARQG